ncbi:MAG: ClpXP protease specificity-enhancing factor SspB [Micavibrio sp.]|nr:ClpXP protease specificity-enhancing factor SspB [Micavibrio sp.]
MAPKNREDAFRYDKMVERALRGVVRQALDEVVKDGLVDDHHFYITFFTDHPGVKLPSYLKDRYPGEMTIVLQHQFYDLEADADKFSVMLSFNNVPERLTIPLQAITIFADPSVNFALQFQPLSEDDDEDVHFEAEELDLDKDDKQKKKGEVVSLDSFRKKGDKDKT